MSDLRQSISWLLLVMVGVVGAGAAVLGVSQAPKNATLKKAVVNTLAAPNYSQVVNQTTTQGKETEYLVWEAPDKLGGYVQSGDKRTYVYVIGSTEYQSLTVPNNTPTKKLVFYQQPAQGPASAVDPTRHYLQYVTTAVTTCLQAKGKSPSCIDQNGNTSTFTLTAGGQTGHFQYTVNGPYVSQVNLTVSGASVQVVISQVGTSPPVALPSGAKVIKAPTAPTSPGTTSPASGGS
jgi:hypothetical protein